jgi:hypothetical protein
VNRPEPGKRRFAICHNVDTRAALDESGPKKRQCVKRREKFRRARRRGR